MIKKLLISALLAFVCFTAHGQFTYFTAALPHDVANPTATPSQSGSRIRIDQPTRRLWVWNETSLTWIRLAQGIDESPGCVAPVGAPVVGQSNFAANTCLVPELYQWTGAAWVCLTCAASGSTNLSWTEVSPTLYRLNSSTGNDVLIKEGANTSAVLSGDTLTISSTGGGGGGTVETDATIDGDGSIATPLKIAQQGAVSSQVLLWTGATWEASWGNPYTFVTTGATITSAVNEILIGTISGNSVFGLPTCDAALDSKHFKFVRNGTDAFSVTIDPSGVQTFYDGTSVKIQYGKLSIDCTCRFSGGVGVWFFDNF